MAANNYIRRKIDADLLSWLRAGKRKPLLLRGARQVGKSSVVRNLGKQFEYFLEVNFERDQYARKLFAEGDLSPQRLCRGLASKYEIPIIPGKTLLFLDEIQASLPAISSLRFFYEDYGDLHVAAAGSLMEFALRELPSLGVGRITPMYVYPMCFSEFLSACGRDILLEDIQNADCEKPLPGSAHDAAVEMLKIFIIIGGMPEVVSAYTSGNDLLACQRILDSLVDTLRADFAKYKEKAPTTRISTVFDSVAVQMGKKFVYTNVSGDYSNRQSKEALELLKMADIVIPVIHTAANGIPLGAEIDIKRQKMFLLDTGIYQRVLKLPLSDLLISDDFALVNKGNIAELFAGLEILKSYSCYERNDLYYWHRESKNSNAEVDFLVQNGWDIIPVEVKSNTKGSMRSIRLFMEEKKSSLGIRTSLENFGEIPGIKIVPLYAVGDFVAGHDRKN